MTGSQLQDRATSGSGFPWPIGLDSVPRRPKRWPNTLPAVRWNPDLSPSPSRQQQSDTCPHQQCGDCPADPTCRSCRGWSGRGRTACRPGGGANGVLLGTLGLRRRAGGAHNGTFARHDGTFRRDRGRDCRVRIRAHPRDLGADCRLRRALRRDSRTRRVPDRTLRLGRDADGGDRRALSRPAGTLRLNLRARGRDRLHGDLSGQRAGRRPDQN